MKTYQLQIGPKVYVTISARSLKAATLAAQSKIVRGTVIIGHVIVEQDQD